MTSVIKGIKSWGNTGLYIRQKNSHWEYNTGGHLQYLTDKRTYRHTNTCKCMYKTHETSLHMCTCNCQCSHTHNTTSDNIYFKDTTCTYWARWIRETQHIVSMPSLAVKNTMNNTIRMTHFSVTPITEHQSSMQHCLNYSYWDGAVVQQQRDFCKGKILTFSSTVILLNIKALRPFCWADHRAQGLTKTNCFLHELTSLPSTSHIYLLWRLCSCQSRFLQKKKKKKRLHTNTKLKP